MSSYLDTQKAAQFLSISPRTLEKLRSSGGGPSYCKLQRRVVYRTADLDRWARAARRTTTRSESHETLR